MDMGQVVVGARGRVEEWTWAKARHVGLAQWALCLWVYAVFARPWEARPVAEKSGLLWQRGLPAPSLLFMPYQVSTMGYNGSHCGDALIAIALTHKERHCGAMSLSSSFGLYPSM
ncbi:hypothetical protein EV1_033630 [Malus domestica]